MPGMEEGPVMLPVTTVWPPPAKVTLPPTRLMLLRVNWPAVEPMVALPVRVIVPA